MSRIKTIFFWVFLLLALGAGIFAYFNLKNSKKPQLSALSVLPDSCFVYFNSNDYFELNKKINSQSLIADKLNLFTEVNYLLNTLQEFDSTFISKDLLKEEISENTIHLAYYGSGWLVTFNLKQLGDQEEMRSYLINTFKGTSTKEGDYQFIFGKRKPLYFELKEGVVLVSNNSDLIRSSLDKSRLKLEKNSSFSVFKNTLSENNLLSIYVNHHLYGQSSAHDHLHLNYLCGKGTSAGNIEIQPSQLIINGFIRPDSSELLSSFYDQEIQSSQSVVNFLPFNTIFFKAYGFSSLSNLIRQKNWKKSDSDFWETVNKKALYNLRSDFEKNAGTHLLQFQTKTNSANVVSIEIVDTLIGREHLVAMSDSVLKCDSFTVFRLIPSMKNKSLHLFQPLLNSKTAYASIYASHILFAENTETLLQTLNSFKNERFLSSNKSFMDYMNQHFPEDFNYLVYNSPNQMKDEISTFLQLKQIEEKDPFLNFKHFSYCVSRNSDDFKFRLQLMHESENKTNDQNSLWTLYLDTTATIPAQGFMNHVTNENEILIQDENNTLYLINAKGTILWKKKINEKICSKIYTVDIYKNGKFQLLFNTKNAIHLIDRNGNYVEAYPVKLPAEASTELSLFDYDTNKDYRLFIACKNNFIYNYNIHGIKQEKFSSVKTEYEVKLPVQYIKIGLSDYLIAMDVEGKIYTFSRKGLGRIGLRNKSIANCTAFYCDINNSINTSYIVYLDDKNALINKISFDDRKEIVKLDSETENADVNFRLIDDNRSMDLLVTKNNSIWSYNFSGNLISENTYVDPLKQGDFYKDESHAFYYSLSNSEKEVVVMDILNQKTQSLKGTLMPFISNLFKDNKKYLILSNGAQLSCVPIN